jgi:ANTAR domain
MSRREELVSQAFVQLADSLVAEFDVIDLLTVLADRSVELLDVNAAGILLADPGGQLRVMAASSEQVRLLELFQLQNNEGPCLDCHTTGQPVETADLGTSRQWPPLQDESAGRRLPLGLRVPDAPALVRDRRVEPLPQDQTVRDAETRTRQLQHALDSRVVIEQAKGMVAEHAKLDMDQAFGRLRSCARSHNRRLGVLAAELVNGTVELSALGESTDGA